MVEQNNERGREGSNKQERQKLAPPVLPLLFI